MRQTSNPNLVQIAVRERLAKYVKYKASVFIFIFPGPTESGPPAAFGAQWLKLRRITQGCSFWGPHDGRPYLGGQILQKPFKRGRG